MKFNKIGIIGGAGVAATNKLCELIEVELTQKGAFRDAHHPELIIYQATKAPSRSMYLEGKGESFIPAYIDIAKKLKLAGAQALCMCCNTAHYAKASIEKEVGLKVLDLIEAIALKIKQSGVKSVALMLSEGCLKAKVYEKYLSQICPKVSIIYPDEAHQRLITKGICNIKNASRFDKKSSKESPAFIFKKVVRHLKELANARGGGVLM